MSLRSPGTPRLNTAGRQSMLYSTVPYKAKCLDVQGVCSSSSGTVGIGLPSRASSSRQQDLHHRE